MAGVVTIKGGAAGTTVGLMFADTINAAAAQAQLDAYALLIGGGLEVMVDFPGGSQGVPTVASPQFGAVAVTVPSANNLGILAERMNLLVVNSPSVTAAIGGPVTADVVAGDGTQLVYVNQAADARIFLGGGIAYIGEAFEGSSATVNVDGGAALGDGAAIIDATRGSTTVNVFGNALVDVIQGRAAVVVQPGTAVVQVSAGASPIAPTIGAAGAGMIEYLQAGGNAVITPGAADVIFLPGGSGGTETLFGGAATIGGAAVSATPFTGSATVFGGTGYLQGGSSGHNALLSSTVAGAATLVGGGDADTLYSFGLGNTLIAGGGNESLYSLASQAVTLEGGIPYTAEPAMGNVFIMGTGDTSFYGTPGGGDTIYAGSGTITGGLFWSFFGTGDPATTRLNASTIYETAPGAHITIGGWYNDTRQGIAGTDTFVMLPGVTAAISNNQIFSTLISDVTLSDGTFLRFINPVLPIEQNGTLIF